MKCPRCQSSRPPRTQTSTLGIVYHVLANHTLYRELGADHYDRRHSQRAARRAIRLLEHQGNRVTLQAAA